MTPLLLIELDSGEVLDKAEAVGDQVVYESGHARQIVEGSARRLGVSDAQALSGIKNWTNGYVGFAAVDAKSLKHLPGQHNQHDHAGVSSAIYGLDVFDSDGYEAEFGDVVNDASVDLGNGTSVSVRFFDSGTAHLALDLPDGRHQVVGDLHHDQGMRDLADDIDRLLALDFEGFDESDADDDGVVDRNDGYLSEVQTGLFADGDLRLASKESEDHVVLGRDEAEALSVALGEMAESWEVEFGDEDAKSFKSRDSADVKRNYVRDGDGQFADVPGVGNDGPGGLDKLKLASRIQLGEGETFVASDVVKVGRHGSVMPMALTKTPDGPRLRIGVNIDDGDQKNWSARDLGATASLDAAGIKRLREVVGEMHTKGDEGGKRFAAIEDRAEELDQARRDILKRQYVSLSKADGKRLDEIDREIERLDQKIANAQQSLRDTADYLSRNDPDARARWDEISAEIATLDPQDDADEIASLQVEQARLAPSYPLARLRAIPSMQEEREDWELERQELTANASPLSAQDQADLDAVEADIASTEAERQQMSETELVEEVIPTDWADLVFEVTTNEMTREYENLGIGYRIAASPKDAPDDWVPSDDDSWVDFDPADLLKLGRTLDGLMSADGSKAAYRSHIKRSSTGETMQLKSFQPEIKAVDSQGDTGTATIAVATLNVVDKDGDVTLPGFFGKQHAQMVPVHDWNHVWIGKAHVYEKGDQCLVDLKFNLKIPAAKDWYEAIKFDYENPPSLAEYSYGYNVLDGGSRKGTFKGQSVRYLTPRPDGTAGGKVFEVSPVLLGAGEGTGTVDVKSRARERIEARKARSVAGGLYAGAVAPHETATVARSWDGVKTVAGLPDDALPSHLRTVYAWVDPSGDPELKASYKFPHHHGVSGPANIRACLAGIAVLNGATGGVDLSDADRKSVYDHLAGHLRDADREPPTLRTDAGEVSGKNLRFGDEAANVLAGVAGLIDRASEVMVLRARKGKGLTANTADLLSWVRDECKRLDSLLSQPIEADDEPSTHVTDEEIASVVLAAVARLHDDN